MSSFLAFIIIFYFLLFMEPPTPKQLTYRDLDAGFTIVSTILEFLIHKIPSPAENPAFKDIDKRIDDFISIKVEGSRTSLKKIGEQGVKEGIRITEEANKIQDSIKSSEDRTPQELNKLLDNIGEIWDKEIHPLLVEANVVKAVEGEEEQPQ